MPPPYAAAMCFGRMYLTRMHLLPPSASSATRASSSLWKISFQAFHRKAISISAFEKVIRLRRVHDAPGHSARSARDWMTLNLGTRTSKTAELGAT